VPATGPASFRAANGIFERLNRDRGITLVVVTHDPEIAAHTRRIVRIHDGLIEGEELVE